MAKTPESNDQVPAQNTDETQPSSQPNSQPNVRPTEQLPMESAPVSAGTAASGGATGLEGSTPPAKKVRGGRNGRNGATGVNGYSDLTRADTQPSVFRRHPIATAVTCGVIAVILVSGLTAWGVGTAVTASLTSSTSAQMPMATATPAPAAGRTSAAERVAFRATIQSISGERWTILTKRGKTVTVDVTSSTQFGTKKSAETSSSFNVGDSVIIVATKSSGGTPTATRVLNSADLGSQLGGGNA